MKHKAIRGMRDLLPDQTGLWRIVEAVIQSHLQRFGYREIRIPLIEETALFARSAGPTTDLVQKEMYNFKDRSDGALTLRPEGTAGCVRAVIEHHLTQQPSRLWYQGAMFRYERPQKGRYRQFEQIGAEAFGWSTPDIDAEMLEMCWRIWEALGLSAQVQLELNTLGSAEARAAYRKRLADYFAAHESDLDEESRPRLQTNPLRILDSKAPKMRQLIEQAPRLIDSLDEASATHFASLRDYLDALGVPYQVNPHVVRGLDYYNGTVFEWTTTALGAQNAICSGGRYDGLVEMLGGKPTPAIGLAFGLDRVLLLAAQVADNRLAADQAEQVDFFILPLTDDELAASLRLASQIRTALPAANVVCHIGGGKVKVRMKAADRSGATYALLLGADEVRANLVTLKALRTDRAQEQLSITNLADRLSMIWHQERTDRASRGS